MADASPESLIDAAHTAAVEFINGYCELVDAANDYEGGWDAELMKQIDELNEPSYVCDLMERIAAARHLLPASKVRLGHPKPTSDGMYWGMAGSNWQDAVGRLVGVMHGSLETVFEEWAERIKSKAFDPDELCAAFVEALRTYPPLCANDVVVDLDIECREALQTITPHQAGNQRSARPRRPLSERAANVLQYARSLYQGERDWCQEQGTIGVLSTMAMEPMVRRLWAMMRPLEQPGMPSEPIDLSDTIRLRREVDEAVRWLSQIVDAANKTGMEPPPAATDQTPPATGASKQGEVADEQFIFAVDGGGYFIKGFGESGHVRKLKGFAYLAKLIERPGTPILMIELLGAEPSDAAADHHSRQPAFDKQAKREVSKKIQELQEEIDDAKERGDVAAQGKATEEKERLLDQLRAATGVKTAKGAFRKDRDLNNPTNRLRSRVQNRLVDAYKTLRSADPPMNELANHFEAAVCAKGATFIYRPVPAILWRTIQQRKSLRET